MTTNQASTQATSDWKATDKDCSFTFNGVKCEVFRDWSCLTREDHATKTFTTVEQMVRYLVGSRRESTPQAQCGCGPSYRDGVRDGIAQEREKTSRLGEFKRGFDVGQTKGDQAGYARGVRDGSEGLVKQTEEVAKREYQRGLADGQKRAGETKAGGFEAGFAQGYAAGGTGKVYEAGIAEGQKRADETHRQLAIALDKVTRTEAQRTTLNNKLAEALCNNGQLALTNSKLSADYQRVREQRDTLRIAEKELGERIDTLYKERDEMRQREEGLKQEAYNAGKKAQVERCDGHNASLLREIEELKRTSSLAFSVRYHQGLSDGACMQKIADDASANELKKKLENTEALLKAAYDRETKKAKDAEELANRLTLTENGRQHWQDEAGRLVAERDCLSRLLDRSERDLQDKDALIVDQKRRLDNSARRLMDCSEEKWRLEDKVMSLEGSDRH